MTIFQEMRLGDLEGAYIIRRGFPTQRATSHGPVPVLSLAAIRNDSPPKHFADWEDIHDLGLELAQPADVLIAIEGGTVGEVLVLPPDINTFIPSQQVATLRVVDRAALDPWYLGAWLTGTPGREEITRLARGSGIQRIPIRELSSLVVKIPPIADQREIGERFFAFEEAIRSHRAVTSCLQELRDLDLGVAFADDGR
jgi:Type I restriction modification DNA specificity domain